MRLLACACAVAVAWLAYRELCAAAWVLVPGALCVVSAIRQTRDGRARVRFDDAAAYYARGIRRLDGLWPGQGRSGARFQDASHPYTSDLDIFGDGSLFELLCSAGTPVGEDRLAVSLSQPASPAEILQRQAAVRELGDRLDLREDLALAAGAAAAAVPAAELTVWAAGPPLGFGRRTPVLAGVLAAALLTGIGLWLGSGQTTPLSVALLLTVAFVWRQRRRVRAAVAHVDGQARELARLGLVLARLSREAFTSPRLRALQARALDGAGRIAELRRLVDLIDARRNPLLAPLGALLLWETQLAMAVERWRLRHGADVPTWLDAVGQAEALLALATYAYEHPASGFPELVPAPLIEAEGLVHPLLPLDRAVRNDVRLGPTLRLLVVSGSNMSGKSTLLRAVGCSAVLALAGAPVPARALRIGPLVVGASIRTLDSLREGRSRFYAEITRLRVLVDIARGPGHLLFLLDELLHGTNSHDRRIGAEAVVRSLLGCGSVGLVTTHDLALTTIADALAPAAANAHFEDSLEGGKLRFDFQLRPGVVAHSNALALMRSIGLLDT